jgi:glycosyltransferase involved in cell wall biosynthesis
MRRIFFDVSAVLRQQGRKPHGMLRAEAEIARFLLGSAGIETVFCAVSRVRRRIVRVSRGDVATALAAGPTANENRLARETGRVAAEATLLLRQAPTPGAEDLYVNVGAFWELAADGVVWRNPSGSGSGMVLFCHDLIPLQLPHLVKNAAFAEKFAAGLPLLLSADLVLCNSAATERDLLAEARRRGTPALRTALLPLGSDGVAAAAECPPARSLPEGGFVLAVGTITLRKNYELLLDLWSGFAADPVMQAVTLVIVGAAGFGAEKILSRIEDDPGLRARVVVIGDASDGTLKFLYRRCLFTVQPSLSEGWGLPVSEALGFGKICVASSNSALPEAGQDLAIHLDAADRPAWSATLWRLVAEPEERLALERRIAEDFKPTTWDDCGRAFVAALAHRHFGQAPS